MKITYLYNQNLESQHNTMDPQKISSLNISKETYREQEHAKSKTAMNTQQYVLFLTRSRRAAERLNTYLRADSYNY